MLSWISCVRENSGDDDHQSAALEEEYPRIIGVKYCVAMSSGTAALHAAVVAAGVLPGDKVIVPALSFLASASAVLHALGIPEFVDIDLHTFNIDPARIEKAHIRKNQSHYGCPLAWLTL